MKLKVALFSSLLLLSGVIFFSVHIQGADAASLYFSPSSGTYTVGNTFNVSAYVNSGGIAINQADPVISFPTSLLEVTSVNKSGSIFTLFTEDVSYSNGSGTISFNGGLPTPGYTGTAGRLINITFRAKAAGTATVSYPSGAVRANDGFGTNVLSSKGTGTYTLSVAAAPPPPPPSEPTAPSTPTITSSTHPNQNAWYQENTAKFSWSMPSDVNGVKVLIDHNAATIPAASSDGVFGNYTHENAEDGAWYIHVRLKNDIGWSGTGHYRYQIDTTPPEYFTIDEQVREDLTDPNIKFIFDAFDATSGIDYYEIIVDDGEPQTWRDENGDGLFSLDGVSAGPHTMTAKVFDKAGNSIETTIQFGIEKIDPPTITEYPTELPICDILVIKGTTYPNATVTIWLQKEGKEAKSFEVKSNEDGTFEFISEDGFCGGNYKMWATVTDSRGFTSDPTEQFTIVVKAPAFFLGLSCQAVVFILLGVILLLLLVILYLWYRNKQLKDQKKYTGSSALEMLISSLRENIRKQIEILIHARSIRDLTEEEKKLFEELKEDYEEIKRSLSREPEVRQSRFEMLKEIKQRLFNLLSKKK